ncbi:unnamed protein product, partial [Urochloa humidicola]
SPVGGERRQRAATVAGQRRAARVGGGGEGRGGEPVRSVKSFGGGGRSSPMSFGWERGDSGRPEMRRAGAFPWRRCLARGAAAAASSPATATSSLQPEGAAAGKGGRWR